MSGYKKPYTLDEERKMLRYIIDTNSYYQLRGRAFWQSMENELDTQRTWQSLKEHFIKHMYFKINNPLYQLTTDEIGQIRDGYMNTASDKLKKAPEKTPAKDLHQYVSSSDSD